MNSPTTNTKLASAAAEPRVLMVAFGCHPEESMETRIGWRRALLSAEHFNTTVLCGPGATADELQAWAANDGFDKSQLEFVPLQHDALGELLTSTATTYLYGYRRWHRKALRLARELHGEKPFSLVHQVNFCGYREPGECWRLGIPFVWGPVGGTQYFPYRFLRIAGLLSAGRELFRNALNWVQLRYSPRVRAAAKTATTVMAATTTGCRHLQQGLGIQPTRQLETGLDCPVAPRRQPRDPNAPLRILWAGRLRPWKGFPLLIDALTKLPRTVAVEVRVLGHGPCRDHWQKQAERAGVDRYIEWIDWPTYPETLPHYRWADIFTFTSLRDTSGTGLLESLAAGTPIVGLNHQGAADLMTEDCAIPIPVTSPAETTTAIADAITELAQNHQKLIRLSEGAQARAARFDWNSRSEITRRIYSHAMTQAGSVSTTDTPDRQIQMQEFVGTVQEDNHQELATSDAQPKQYLHSGEPALLGSSDSHVN